MTDDTADRHGRQHDDSRLDCSNGRKAWHRRAARAKKGRLASAGGPQQADDSREGEQPGDGDDSGRHDGETGSGIRRRVDVAKGLREVAGDRGVLVGDRRVGGSGIRCPVDGGGGAAKPGCRRVGGGNERPAHERGVGHGANGGLVHDERPCVIR